mgnify:CR=1 FL=1
MCLNGNRIVIINGFPTNRIMIMLLRQRVGDRIVVNVITYNQSCLMVHLTYIRENIAKGNKRLNKLLRKK